MSLLNSSSGAHFLNLSAYNRFRSFISRRSDSSVSDAESIQSSRAEEQGSTGDCIPTQRTEGEILSSPNLKAFSFKELKSATSNFSPDSLIGEGAFGYVFKGWIDDQTCTASRPGVGMVVAVKKLKPEGFQGHKEWLTEIRYLGQLRHPNLVKLIGFCSDGDNRLLVNEFMPRGNLDNHLFGRRAQSLSWATRIEIAIGAAKGLALLHDAESQVIHRHVTPSNILLDSDFNAKLADFGLARAGPTGDMTHVSTQVMGTYGYAAPEYIATGHLSAKADVYSFGVVLLELLSGRRTIDKSKSASSTISSSSSIIFSSNSENISVKEGGKLIIIARVAAIPTTQSSNRENPPPPPLLLLTMMMMIMAVAVMMITTLTRRTYPPLFGTMDVSNGESCGPWFLRFKRHCHGHLGRLQDATVALFV